MRSTMTLAAVALVAMMVGSAAPVVSANPPRAPQAAGGGDNDLPRRTIRAFAPFIRALVTHRNNQADRIFKMQRGVQGVLEHAETVRIMQGFQKPDGLELNLIGGRTLGQNIGVLLFTVATEDGPVAFKIRYYGFGNAITVAGLDITDDWDEIERMSLTVDSLPTPLTAMLGQVDDNPPQPQ